MFIGFFLVFKVHRVFLVFNIHRVLFGLQFFLFFNVPRPACAELARAASARAPAPLP